MKKVKRFFNELFVPQESNDHKAKILHPSFLALLVGVFLVNQLALNFIALARPGVLGYTSDITPEKIVELTNSKRQQQGLEVLSINEVLSNAARMKAEDMFAFDYWAHTSPSGKTPWTFFKQAGYNYIVAGENLAKDFSNPDSVVEAWMKSPTHKANIVDGRFSEIGVAVVEGDLNGFRTTLVVQLFGSPASVQPQAVQTPKTSTQAAGLKTENPKLVPEKVEELSSAPQPVANPLNITKGISGVLFGVIIGGVVVDGYFVLRNKTHRFSGRNLAHAGFLVIVFFLILLSQQGAVY
jgi:uncharacterized protein YkwD